MRIFILPTLYGFFLITTLIQAAPLTNAPANTSLPTGTASTANKNALTPDEWQELRTARLEALKANPHLAIQAAQLSAKLRQFQQKLIAAMLKTDPELAPVLETFAGNRPPPHPASPPPAKTQ